MAAGLLLTGVLRHYAWELFPSALAYDAWQATAAAVVLGLVVVVTWGRWSPAVAIVVAWWAIEESLVFGCSVGQMVRPWPVAEGVEQCSALVGVKLGALGLFVVALIAASLAGPRKDDSIKTPKDLGQ